MIRIYSHKKGGKAKRDACYYKVKSRYKVFPCMPVSNTKILTNEGWKGYSELRLEDDVVTYDANKDRSYMNPITKIHFFRNAKVYVVEGSNRFITHCTKDHRWLTKHGLKTIKECITYKFDIILNPELNKVISDLRYVDYYYSDVFCISTPNQNFNYYQHIDDRIVTGFTGNSAYASGALVQCRKVGANNWGTSSKAKGGIFDKEQKEGLRGWFGRNNGKGWVDCISGEQCGGKKAGTKRLCRPTKADCPSKSKISKLKKKKTMGKAISWKKEGGTIHIKPENRGKFTEWCRQKGYKGVTNSCIAEGKKSTPAVRKQAVFAENARSWRK